MITKLASGSLLRCVNVGGDLLTVFFIVVRQNIGIRHAHHLQTEDARHLLLINKVGITESLEPGEIIKHRVINAVRTGRTDVCRRDTEMLQERSIVRTAAQITDRYIGLTLCSRRAIVRGRRLLLRAFPSRLISFLPSAINGTPLRARDSLGHITQKLLQAGYRRSTKLRTGDRYIDVEI